MKREINTSDNSLYTRNTTITYMSSTIVHTGETLADAVTSDTGPWLSTRGSMGYAKRYRLRIHLADGFQRANNPDNWWQYKETEMDVMVDQSDPIMTKAREIIQRATDQQKQNGGKFVRNTKASSKKFATRYSPYWCTIALYRKLVWKTCWKTTRNLMKSTDGWIVPRKQRRHVDTGV